MVTGFARYVDRCTNEPLSVEVAFNGGVPRSTDRMNPRETDVVIRLLRRANAQWETSPWIERWAQSYGDSIMPSGAWNGIKLCEIIADRVFVAVGSELSEVHVNTGKVLWTLTTGNTAISWIMKSSDDSALIVFNGYYGFSREDHLSNIACVELNGVEKWRSPRSSIKDDIFSNHPFFEGPLLKACSWRGEDCTIDELTGEIVERHFSK